MDGEIFSIAQVNKLLLKRELVRRKADLQRQLNEEMVAMVVRPHLTQEMLGEEKLEMTALRIASQDEGHAILLRKRSSKERATDLREKLERLGTAHVIIIDF